LLCEIVKWAGDIHIACLHVQQIKLAYSDPMEPLVKSGRVSIGIGFFTGALNPAAIMFYIAFLAQLIDPHGDTGWSSEILTETSTGVAGGVPGAYVLAVMRAGWASQSPRMRRWFEYTGGAAFLTGAVY